MGSGAVSAGAKLNDDEVVAHVWSKAMRDDTEIQFRQVLPQLLLDGHGRRNSCDA